VEPLPTVLGGVEVVWALAWAWVEDKGRKQTAAAKSDSSGVFLFFISSLCR